MRRGVGKEREGTVVGDRGGERIRSFVAVDLDPSVLDALRRLQAELAATRADVRWVRPAGMHLTLKFLGPVTPAHLDRVHGALREALRDRPALTMMARGIGAFPSLRRPRVVWAGLAGDGLGDLARCVEATLEPLGFAAEGRELTPHVTLGRVNSMRGWPALAAVIDRHKADELGCTAVGAVIVYRSVLHRDGAQYSVLWSIPLGSSIANNSQLG